MAAGLSALRIEFLTDPVGIGYGSYVSNGNHNGLVRLINSVSANTGTAGSAITVGNIFALGLQQAVVAAEYVALNQAQRDLWNAVITTAVTGISISNTVIRGQITTVWSAGTTTRTNLAALQTRLCSRAETLFGEGIVVEPNEATKAVNGDF